MERFIELHQLSEIRYHLESGGYQKSDSHFPAQTSSLQRRFRKTKTVESCCIPNRRPIVTEHLDFLPNVRVTKYMVSENRAASCIILFRFNDASTNVNYYS